MVNGPWLNNSLFVVLTLPEAFSGVFIWWGEDIYHYKRPCRIYPSLTPVKTPMNTSNKCISNKHFF